jgi:hypothetical protein
MRYGDHVEDGGLAYRRGCDRKALPTLIAGRQRFLRAAIDLRKQTSDSLGILSAKTFINSRVETV